MTGGPQTVFEEADKIIISMGIRPNPCSTSEKSDVAIAVSKTPSGRRIMEIESMVKSDGSRKTLRVTISAA